MSLKSNWPQIKRTLEQSQASYFKPVAYPMMMDGMWPAGLLHR